MLLARLRWSAFGLRGRIVGAVLATTAVSLGAAALVLLPRLETVLTQASKSTLRSAVLHAGPELNKLRQIQYELIPVGLIAPRGSAVARQASAAASQLVSWESALRNRFGDADVALCGPLDYQGNCSLVIPSVNQSDGTALAEVAAAKPLSDIRLAFGHRQPYVSLGSNGTTVRAAVWLKAADAVLVVRIANNEIGATVTAVRHAFEIGAGVAIILTVLIAIPLAGTLVSRLQRLRQAALQIAIGSSVTSLPAERARDEVGDLSRSFSIMQRRLRQQEEARRAFVATASHELRTPLASLEGMLELLEEDLHADQPDLEDAASLLERARVQSRRLARLAADLLDLSRIDAEVGLRSEPVSLGELGRAVLAEFELASATRGASIRLAEDATPAWALADPGSVARILRILLDNALRVAPAGSEIEVQVSALPEPTLTVSDQGPGVSKEERALIFERFKRGRETGGEAGFGLGLAIGRELAQRMGGSLVLAESAGAGATFMLRLRAAEPPLSEPSPQAAEF